MGVHEYHLAVTRGNGETETGICGSVVYALVSIHRSWVRSQTEIMYFSFPLACVCSINILMSTYNIHVHIGTKFVYLECRLDQLMFSHCNRTRAKPLDIVTCDQKDIVLSFLVCTYTGTHTVVDSYIINKHSSNIGTTH